MEKNELILEFSKIFWLSSNFNIVFQRPLLWRGGCVLRLLRHAGHSPVPVWVLLDHLLRGPDGVAGGDVHHDGLEDGHHQQAEAEPDDRGWDSQHGQGKNQEGSPQNVRYEDKCSCWWWAENDFLNIGPRRDILQLSGGCYPTRKKVIICFLSAVVVFCFFACWAPLHTQRLLYVAHFIHK